MRKWLGLVLIAALLLSGCTRIDQQVNGRPRLVTGIEASFDNGTLRLHRLYSDNEKLRGVLTYLRCLEIKGTVEPDTEIPGTSQGKIVISYSDGSSKTYEQRNDNFFRQDNGPWHYIDPEQGQEYALLLGLMESDKIS